jgi:alpha-glucosidase
MKKNETKVLTPHHDGSELYVSNSAPSIGDKVRLNVRIPKSYSFKGAFVRVYEDAEPRVYPLKKQKSGKK